MGKLATAVLLLALLGGIRADYDPDWESLDSRPVPAWFDEAKIGIFLHWGVFSVPSFGSEWFWNKLVTNDSSTVEYMSKYYRPGFSYQEFAKEFTAELFDANTWAGIFKRAGAKYVVLTSKHHEGYTLWPSKYSYSWNSQDVGPHRDLVGELGDAVRNAGLKYGLYHSLYEWYHPLYIADKASNFKSQDFVNGKVFPELVELVNTYKPSLIWSDGEWEAPDTYWRATEFLAWLYNESPIKDEVAVNDRWGNGTACNHGNYLTCYDKFNPGTLQKKKWESAISLDKDSWGFRRNAQLSDYLTISELISNLVTTISCGGNLLINVGPTKDGVIDPIFEERLTQLGEWLDVNGEAIYGSQPWHTQNDTLNGNVWYTKRGTAVYAIDLEWPEGGRVVLGSVSDLFSSNATKVSLLGYSGTLPYVLNGSQVIVHLPDSAPVPGHTAYTLKIYP